FDLHLGCCERGEPAEVQAVVAEGAVEALDEAVLHRLARLNEVALDATGIRPGVERPTRELCTVVGNDHVGQTSLAPQALELLDDPHRWQRSETSIARHSRVNSSMVFRQRKRRPLASASLMRSMLQRWFARSSSGRTCVFRS